MKIGMTTSGADSGRSGIGRYATQLLTSLSNLEDPPAIELLGDAQDAAVFDVGGAGQTYTCINGLPRSPVPNILWHQLSLPRICKKNGYDVLFLPAANRRIPVWAPCPTVGVVHDLSALHVEDKYGAARVTYITKVLPLLIRRLSRVITLSESSKRDIVGAAGVPESRVTVIPLAAEPAIFSPRDPKEAQRRIQQAYGLERPFILYVSRIEHPGKNHAGLIRAFGALRSSEHMSHQLVFAGPDWSRADKVHALARQSPWSDDIKFIGWVPTEDLSLLYSAADLTVFPSLYEGFGLPILEAMACGAPVACSNTSSMPEVAGDAALLFDPHDTDSIANAMRILVRNRRANELFRQLGPRRSIAFSWDRTANRTLDVIKQVHGEALREESRHHRNNATQGAVQWPSRP